MYAGAILILSSISFKDYSTVNSIICLGLQLLKVALVVLESITLQ